MHGLAARIVKKFDEELGHIQLDTVQFAWKKSKSSRYHGRTRLIRGEWCMFTNKKVVITFWLKSWKEHKPSWRALLVYHELRHIFPPKKEGGDYRIRRHDIEDFADLIEKYGTRWERSEDFLKTIITK
jgi:hypothetical protein